MWSLMISPSFKCNKKQSNPTKSFKRCNKMTSSLEMCDRMLITSSEFITRNVWLDFFLMFYIFKVVECHCLWARCVCYYDLLTAISVVFVTVIPLMFFGFTKLPLFGYVKELFFCFSFELWWGGGIKVWVRVWKHLKCLFRNKFVKKFIRCNVYVSSKYRWIALSYYGLFIKRVDFSEVIITIN